MARPILSTEALSALREYGAAGTRGAFSLQRLSGATELMKAGLIEWHGEYLGTSQYSITDAGRALLAKETR